MSTDDQFENTDNYPATGSWSADDLPQTELTGATGPTIPDQPAIKEEEENKAETPVLPPLEIVQKFVDFVVKRNISSEVTDEKEETLLGLILENPDTFNLVLERSNEILKGMSNGNLSTTGKDKDWLTALVSGMAHTSLESVPIKATERHNSSWKQGITIGADSEDLYRPGRPSQKYDRNKRLTKEEQLAFLHKKQGTGATYETFAPHSGIWLRLRSPTLTEIASLQAEIQQVKSTLGMASKGMAFSNASAIMMNAITDLALNCIIASNKQYTTPTDFEYELSILDEVVLHHALAATMFPDGFNYAVPCIADMETCNAKITRKLNMSSIVWYDNNVFTAEQRKFIGKRFTPAADIDFETYRKGFSIGGSKVIWHGEVGLRLNIPTIAQRKAAAAQWISTLTEMSQGVFNEPVHGPNRAAYIEKLSKATTAMQYAHWVDAIYVKDDEVTDFDDQLFSTEEEVIVSHLSDSISTQEFAEKFFENVHDYINSSIIPVVALPSHNCKSCNTPQGAAFNDRFPHLVPLDVLGVFFTLAAQKVKHLE